MSAKSNKKRTTSKNKQTTTQPTKKRQTSKKHLISKSKIRTLLLTRLQRHSRLKNKQKKSVRKIERQFLDSLMAEDLTCPLCMDIFLRPYSLQCGHVFCYHCIDSLSKHDNICNQCPVCRSPINEIYPTQSKFIEHSISDFINSKMSIADKKQYQQRSKKVLEEFQERIMGYSRVRVGEKIDVKVGNRWQVGTVINRSQKQSIKKIFVKSQRSRTMYTFSEGTTHLAHYNTFTRQAEFDIADFLELNSFSDMVIDFREIGYNRINLDQLLSDSY